MILSSYTFWVLRWQNSAQQQGMIVWPSARSFSKRCLLKSADPQVVRLWATHPGNPWYCWHATMTYHFERTTRLFPTSCFFGNRRECQNIFHILASLVGNKQTVALKHNQPAWFRRTNRPCSASLASARVPDNRIFMLDSIKGMCCCVCQDS